jgi:colanic acid/amylovoran biosynthesis glycosyltransferase
MRIAYLTGRYPATSHTFIAREVAALRGRGLDVQTFSIWSVDPRDLPTPEDREESARTYAILPPRPGRAARAHWSAVRRAPRAFAAALAQAVRLGRPGVRGRALGGSWFIEAIILWDQLRRRGIRHLHVHLNGTAPSVGVVLTSFANAAADDGKPWSWSLTVHGSSEFYDVYGERLAEKVRSASAVVCVSDFARSQLMAHVEEPEWRKLRVVHCGVDPDVFDCHRSAPGGVFELLTVARLTRAKGHAVLLAALENLDRHGNKARLTIVGDGPERENLERLARKMGVASHVRFVGVVAQDSVREYYQGADAFCLASFAEGVPVVLMEAMAMQLPVVATDVMGVRELVEDGVNGLLVRPGRPDLLAAAMARLAADPDLRRRLGVTGRAVVQRDVNICRSAEQLDQLFAEVLRSSEPRR